MEIEPEPNQNNNTNNSGLDINPVFAELQIKRDNRRTSERMNAHNISLSSNGGRSEDSIGVSDDFARQNSDENGDRPASLQILNSPDTSPRGAQTSNRNLGANLMSYLQNLTNPFRRGTTSSQSQQQQQQNSRPLPLYLNPFVNSSSNLGPAQVGQNHVNLPQMTNAEGTANQQQNAGTQTGNAFGNFPHGALIVRTVTPGPNDTVIVSMRIIPIDEILGGEQAHSHEGQGAESGSFALFGALLGMLSGGLNVERGLEKEALDDLPVVTFDSEAFKNVDAESKKCPICFDEYEDGHEVRYLWCLHRFHKTCVDQWLGNHSTCPICKKDYADAKKSTFEEEEVEHQTK